MLQEMSDDTGGVDRSANQAANKIQPRSNMTLSEKQTIKAPMSRIRALALIISESSATWPQIAFVPCPMLSQAFS
jgi:hypothetical protein